MSHEDYVSYQTSIALKEAGFDWYCDFVYFIHSGVKKPQFTDYESAAEQTEYYDGVKIYDAPSLYEVQKWLREVKKTVVYVVPVPKVNYTGNRPIVDTHSWQAVVGTKKGLKYPCLGPHDNYEQALSDGINTALFIINEKL